VCGILPGEMPREIFHDLTEPITAAVLHRQRIAAKRILCAVAAEFRSYCEWASSGQLVAAAASLLNQAKSYHGIVEATRTQQLELELQDRLQTTQPGLRFG